MDEYIDKITDLTNRYVSSITVFTTEKSDPYNKEYIAPSAISIRKTLIITSVCFNPFSRNYRSASLLKTASEYLNNAISLVNKGMYEPVSFCMSVIHASYVYRLAKKHTKALFTHDTHIGKDLQRAALDYIEGAKQLIQSLKKDTVFKYAALIHCARDMEDNNLKQCVKEMKERVQDEEYFSVQYLQALCDIHNETKDKQYLKKALNVMTSVLKLTEPDNTVIDLKEEKNNLDKRGSTVYLWDYIDSLMYLSLADNNERLCNVLSYVFNIIDENGCPKSSDNVLLLPVFTLLNKKLFSIILPETTKNKALSSFNGFVGDNVYRYGTGTYISQTVSKEQDTFYTMQCGDLKVRLRFNATYFGPRGRFRSDVLEETDTGLRLRYIRDWGYWLPLEDRSVPAIIGQDVNKVDRTMTNLQHIDMQADIKFLDNGADITISIKGTDGLATKLDLIFEKHGLFDCEYVSTQAAGNDFIQLQQGNFTYTAGSDRITAGPAFNELSIGSEGLRGSNPPIENSFTVYFTGMTPSVHTVRIRGDRT